MTRLLLEFQRLTPLLAWAAVLFALVVIVAIVLERVLFAVKEARRRRITEHYGPIVQRALAGDEEARRELAATPERHTVVFAWLLIAPLIRDRNPQHIAGARAVLRATPVPGLVDRYLHSGLWWRRSLALRAVGLLEARRYTAQIVAALEDPHPDVRAAALDALTDMHDPASLPALIVRIHDTSLHRGRRGAALKAFGFRCEPLLLELAEADPTHRVNFAHALAICGTSRSRAMLCRWTTDSRADVREAAFQALSYVGLDVDAARLALEALDRDEPPVRAMAAFALRGWVGPGDAAARLAAHLDDTWTVAVTAGRTLLSMGQCGIAELEARASRPDLTGELARQMLWQPDARDSRS